VDLGEFGVEEELDLAVLDLLHRALDPHVLGAELLAAVGDVDGVRELRQEVRLLHRGVAAADDEHVLVAEERAVAGRTRREPVSHQLVLAGDAEGAGAGTRGGDERVGGVHVAVGEFDAEVACGLFRDVHDDSVSSLGAELRRLRFHVVDQLRPGDSLGEAGVVLHVGSERELAARLVALDEQRIVVRPRGVDSCRESGDPGAGDNQPAVFDDVVGHGYWFAVAKYVGCALGRGGRDSERGWGPGHQKNWRPG